MIATAILIALMIVVFGFFSPDPQVKMMHKLRKELEAPKGSPVHCNNISCNVETEVGQEFCGSWCANDYANKPDKFK